MRKLVGLILLVWAIGSPVFGSSISNVAGTISNGNSITVYGTGFGTTGPTVVLFDDFERGTVGDYLRFALPQIGQWHLQKNSPLYASDFVRSGTRSLAVSQYTFNDLGRWCGNTGTPPSNPEDEGGCDNVEPGSSRYQSFAIDFQTLTPSGETDEIYFEYSYYIPPGNTYPGGDHNFKTDWLLGTRTDAANDWRFLGGGGLLNLPNANGEMEGGFGSNSGFPELETCGTPPRNMYPWGYVFISPVNRWGRVMNYAFSSTGCSGEIWHAQIPFPSVTTLGFRCDSVSHCVGGTNSGGVCTGHDLCPGGYCDYQDGYADRNTCQMVRKHRTGHTTFNAGSYEGYARLGFNAYARNEADPGNHYYWRYDDVYVAIGSGARARVEISSTRTWGDPAYSSTIDMMVCTPTSWSASAVSCTYRSGGFSPGQTAYVFVVDADGNISDQDTGTVGYQGYQITIGGTASGPTRRTDIR